MKRTLMLVCMIMIVYLQYGVVLFNDDFNRTEGSAVGNSWTNIGPVSPIIENSSMKVISNSLQGVRRDFTSLGITSGIYYVSYDWKITSNNWLADAFPNGTVTYLRHDYEGNLYYDNTSDFSNPITIGSLATDTWANFKLKVNIDTDRFSLWINNTLVADNIAGLSVTDFTRFTFRAGSGSTVTQYVDNFIVYNDTPPATPTNLTATGSVNDITLSWTGSPQDFLTYKIYRKTTSPADVFLAEVPGTQTTYTDFTAAANTNHFYRVKAVSMSTIESGFSNEATAHLQPQAVVIPSSINVSVGYGYDTNTSINIANMGSYDLTYSIERYENYIYGSGLDGDLTVNIGETYYTDSVKTPVSGANFSGQNTLNVLTAAGFSIGDEVLIITMKDNNSNLSQNLVGQHEIHRISGINGDIMALDNNLIFEYNQTDTVKHQVLKIMNFNNVTVHGIITCSDWNGTIGGVICFRSLNQVTISPTGQINASSKGYVGGSRNYYSGNSCGYGGESFTGVPVRTQANVFGAGGGGNRIDSNRGGGGGAGYSSDGGSGGSMQAEPASGGFGGTQYGSININKLFLGSGGGAGAVHYDGYGYGGKGGNGGGIILMYSNQILNHGIITSSGENGERASGNVTHGGGGGGSGGTIVIKSSSFNNYNNITSLGGEAGYTNFWSGSSQPPHGGSASTGRIRIDGSFQNNSIVNPSPFLEPLLIIDEPLLGSLSYSGIVNPGDVVQINLSLNSSILPVGSTIDSLLINFNDPQNSVQLIVIDITITPPIVSIDQNTDEIVVNTNNYLSNFPFTIRNDGEGILDFNIGGLDEFSQTLLGFTQTEGVIEQHDSQTISFIINGTGLNDGVHQAYIKVISNAIAPTDSLVFPLQIKYDISPPTTPTGLCFDEMLSDMNQIRISWTANALADSIYSYKVFRRGLHDTIWSLKGTVGAGHNWFIDNQFTGLDTTAVYYKITAIDWVDNESAASEEVMAWLQRFPAPTGLTMEIIRDRHVQLTWNPVTQTISGNPGTPSCYVIYRSNTPSPIEDFYFVGAVDATTFTHNWAAWFIEIGKQFYVVTAYSGSFEDLRAVADSRREWKFGELERVLNKSHNNDIQEY